SELSSLPTMSAPSEAAPGPSSLDRMIATSASGSSGVPELSSSDRRDVSVLWTPSWDELCEEALASCRVASTVVGVESSAAVFGAAPGAVRRGAAARGAALAREGEAGTGCVPPQEGLGQ